MILLASAALAAPDHVAAILDSGTPVSDLGLSSDGQVLAFHNGTGTVTVFSTYGWIGSSVATDCTTTAGIAVAVADSGWIVLVGCDDGRVIEIETDALGRPGDPADLATVDSAGAVHGLETDDTDVYVIYDDGDGGGDATAVTLAEGSQVSDWPISLAYGEVVDTAHYSGTLVVSHGGNDVSKITTSSASSITPTESISGSFGDVTAYNASTFYVVDTEGSILSFLTSDNDLQIMLDDIADGLSGVSLNAEEGWLLAAGDATVLRYAFGDSPTDLEAEFEASGIGEMVALDGYAAGASDSGVQVLTDRPWVAELSLDPDYVATGSEVTLQFTADVDGSYVVQRGTSSTLASGDCVAGEVTTTSFEVDSDFDEGDHRIYVTVTASLLEGVGAADLTVNNPPGGIDLGQEDVTGGDESIHVDVGDMDDDTAYIDVYLVNFPWEPSEYESGGPAYGGPDGLTNPISFAVTPGVDDEVVVDKLTNDTTYYVGVRPRDSTGLEGPMSDVFPATPQESYTLEEMYDDDTPWCGVATPELGWLGVLAAAFVAGRRLRSGRRAGMAALLLGPALIGEAQAKEADLTPRHWNFEVKYGPLISQADPYLTSAFGETGNSMLRVDYGWCSNLLEFDLGTGIYRDTGYLLDKNGAVTGDDTFFTVIPLELALTGRIDFLHEQPAVPFAKIGAGYSIYVQDWQEEPSSAELESRAGGRFGWFWGAGVMFLLDGLDRGSASRLEANTGINDTYIVAEYRQNFSIMSGEQLDLSSTELDFGLKFDF